MESIMDYITNTPWLFWIVFLAAVFTLVRVLRAVTSTAPGDLSFNTIWESLIGPKTDDAPVPASRRMSWGGRS